MCIYMIYSLLDYYLFNNIISFCISWVFIPVEKVSWRLICHGASKCLQKNKKYNKNKNTNFWGLSFNFGLNTIKNEHFFNYYYSAME